MQGSAFRGLEMLILIFTPFSTSKNLHFWAKTRIFQLKRLNITALHKDRLTDRHEISTVASGHHYRPEKTIHFRFGRKSKMAAGNGRQNTHISICRRPLDRSS